MTVFKTKYVIKCILFIFRLKLRIKALSSTVDQQSCRITDLMSAQAMAGLEGGEWRSSFI